MLIYLKITNNSHYKYYYSCLGALLLAKLMDEWWTTHSQHCKYSSPRAASHTHNTSSEHLWFIGITLIKYDGGWFLERRWWPGVSGIVDEERWVVLDERHVRGRI